jgi:hypothetical protein
MDSTDDALFVPEGGLYRWNNKFQPQEEMMIPPDDVAARQDDLLLIIYDQEGMPKAIDSWEKIACNVNRVIPAANIV